MTAAWVTAYATISVAVFTAALAGVAWLQLKRIAKQTRKQASQDGRTLLQSQKQTQTVVVNDSGKTEEWYRVLDDDWAREAYPDAPGYSAEVEEITYAKVRTFQQHSKKFHAKVRKGANVVVAHKGRSGDEDDFAREFRDWCDDKVRELSEKDDDNE